MIDLSNNKPTTKKCIHENKYIFYYNDNEVYLGEYDDKINGYGKYFNKDYYYHGLWKNNIATGQGIFNDKKKNIQYNGIFLNGLPEGEGKEIYNNGYSYIGEFKQGLKHGYGKFCFNNNIIYEGLWYDNTIVNNGEKKIIYDFKGNKKYEAENIEFRDNFYIINSIIIKYKIIQNKLQIIFEGNMLNNKYDGIGTIYHYDKQTNEIWKLYEGMFEQNNFNGKGCLYNQDGSIYYCGNFKDGIISDKHVNILNTTHKNHFKFNGRINQVKNIKNYYPEFTILEGRLEDYKDNYILQGKFKEDYIDTNCELYDTNEKCFIEKINKRDRYNIIDKELIFEGFISNNELDGILTLKERNIKYIGTLNNWDRTKYHYIINPQYNKGVLYNNFNIKISEGTYQNNKLHGLGIKYNKLGFKESFGNYFNHMLHGRGTTYWPNNKIQYSGDFNKGYRHGQGQLYDNQGCLIFSGRFNYNDPV